MIAQEMSRSENRGRIIWILASSRPDLIEVDLKRPGRVDVKIPLLPTTTARESFDLLRTLCKVRGIDIHNDAFTGLEPKMPLMLTPGAAETLAVKLYRMVRTRTCDPTEGLKLCLTDYRNPVSLEVLNFQIQLALDEASDPDFIPEFFTKRTA